MTANPLTHHKSIRKSNAKHFEFKSVKDAKKKNQAKLPFVILQAHPLFGSLWTALLYFHNNLLLLLLLC